LNASTASVLRKESSKKIRGGKMPIAAFLFSLTWGILTVFLLLLVRAGAKLDARWFEVDDEERRRAIAKMRSDPRMQAALRGEMPQ